MPNGNAVVPTVPAKIDLTPIALLQGTHHIGNLSRLGRVFQRWWWQRERLRCLERGVTKTYEAFLTHNDWDIHRRMAPAASCQTAKLCLAEWLDHLSNERCLAET
jgi:hypothetical protein